jgi:hypothetical protein
MLSGTQLKEQPSLIQRINLQLALQMACAANSRK